MDNNKYNKLEFAILQTKEEIAELQSKLETLQELRDKFLKALEENKNRVNNTKPIENIWKD